MKHLNRDQKKVRLKIVLKELRDWRKLQRKAKADNDWKLHCTYRDMCASKRKEAHDLIGAYKNRIFIK